jgi:hypothetical protein
MISQTSEYLDSREEPAIEHNDRQKNFEIKPAKDPDRQKIFDARDAGITDPALTDGARNLFNYLLELSLNPYANNWRRGQVGISVTQLSERLSRSARAIYGWTRELVAQRHIWVTKLARPNTRPMNVYHITALQPHRQLGPEVAYDAMWGNGYRRPDQPMPLGARGATCTKRQVILNQYGKPISSKTLENAVATGKKCGSFPQVLREPPAQNDTCQPQTLRETPAKLAGDSRTKRHLPPAQNDTTPRQERAVLIESQIDKESTSETSSSVQRGHAFKKGGENGYLLHVLEVLSARSPREAELELANSGAWWRLKYREDADKACRVLAEIKRMITEGVPFTNNPGACAVDLWKRFV